ncbi:multidrug effflux MFS transporter [Croceicoccus sp. F390]|uniref:Bcr/CflA family efflux transporter n=1 Tax=Croceicoccus esteveae TaxID=3075597 RepID=A0ABU2ZDZ7_9SPHN|nr:multidrug effflux MFS transporter [Croceicoccus sp. F390]MDT0574826.1 multidrug effflux MFS transporter [Croceicoccus sp. F390]
MNRSRRKPVTLGDFEFVTMLAMLMALQALGIDTMLPALGEIAGDLGAANPNDRQLIIGTYMIGMGIGALAFGFLADRFGRKPVLMAGIGMYCLFSLACMLVQDFTVMLVLRFFHGVVASAGAVVANAVVRDRFEGDRMARTISLIAMVFMIVPVLAPTIGQAILFVAGWHVIFGLLAFLSAVMLVWTGLRLSETLHPEDRQTLQPGRIMLNFRLVLTNRDALGYVLGAALVFGGLYAFINMSEQLIGGHFAQGDRFPLIFGLLAISMAATNFINSRIVERFGARPVSHAALLVFVAAGAGQWAVSTIYPDSLLLFLPFMMVNMALIGFLGANFSSISLQPFARIAGSASSLQTSIRVGGGAALGSLVGALYDGTAQPLGAALFLMGFSGLILVMFSEKGRLFRRRSSTIPLV